MLFELYSYSIVVVTAVMFTKENNISDFLFAP